MTLSSNSGLAGVRVMPIHSDQSMLDGIRNLVESHAGFEFAGEATNIADACRSARKALPDVLVVGGECATDRVLEVERALSGAILAAPRTPAIVVLTPALGGAGPALTAMTFRASGFIREDRVEADLLPLVGFLGRSFICIATSIAEEFFPGLAAGAREEAAAKQRMWELLTERERTVLTRLADGRTYPQIAAELFVTVHAVRKNMASIFDKLDVHSQAQAVSMILRSATAASPLAAAPGIEETGA